jgi:TPR repeat protein
MKLNAAKRPGAAPGLLTFGLLLALAGPARGGADEDLLEAAKLHRIGESGQSLAIWRRLAEQGQVDAQYNLGVVHHHGDGVKQDFAAAMKWYARAAEQGDIEAQRAIGTMYLRGQGVRRDERAGMRWVMLDKIAAHHDHMRVAEKWRGELERAILRDEQRRLELLYVQSLDDGERTLAELRRRAGGGADTAPQLAGVR